MRIYLVNTPAGKRLVEASTKGQAINYCVSTDYSAEPISSSDLYAAIQAGAQVEKVVPAKKSVGEEPSTSPMQQGSLAAGLSKPQESIVSSNPPIQQTPQGSIGNLPHFGVTGGQTAPAPAPVASPIVSAAPAADTPAFLKGKAPEGGWQEPAPAASINPIIAEQQRINPEAARAAGVAPIIARTAPAPRPEPEETEWQDRAVLPNTQ